MGIDKFVKGGGWDVVKCIYANTYLDIGIIMPLLWHCLFKVNGYSHRCSMQGMCSMETSSSI